MLNARVKELMSEGFLNFCLILVNILIPAGTAAEQIYRNTVETDDVPASKVEEGTETVNPLGVGGDDAKD